MSMRRRTRANPKGLSRTISMASATKIGRGFHRDASGWTMDPPSVVANPKRFGNDVKDWSGIHVTFTTNSDAYENPNPAYIQVRVWRFYNTHPLETGDNRMEGAWIQGEDRIIPLTGTAMTPEYSQHHVFDTRNSDKMYIQLVATFVAGEEPPPFDDIVEWIRVQMWGYTRKDEPIGVDISAGGTGVAPGDGGVVVEFPPVHGPEDEPVPAEAIYQGVNARAAQRPPVDNDNDLVGLVGNRFGELVLAGYNWIAQALRIEEINPIYTRQDPAPEIEEGGGVTAPVGSPIEIFIDMNDYQHHALQVVTDYLTPGGAPADVVEVDLAYTARPGGAPATFAATDWTPINTEMFGTATQVPLSTAAGQINKLFTGNFFRGQWLRLRAWATASGGGGGAPVGNVALWTFRQSWY